MRDLIGIVTLCALLLSTSLVSAASKEAADRVALGIKLLEQGKLEAAIGELQKASAIDPKDGAVQLHLGYAYERANRNDEAIDAYRKSIELEPHNFYARNNVGVLYDKQGKYDEAITEFQNALNEDPNNPTAVKNLETAQKNKATVQQQNQQISRAIKEVEAKPQDPMPAYQLARLYASQNKKEAAVEWLTKAIQLGYKDFAYVKADPAFVTMREEREFQLLLLRK